MANPNTKLGDTMVVSLRIPVDVMKMTQAAAALVDSTPNAFIREALETALETFSQRPDLLLKKEQFLAKNEELLRELLDKSASKP